MGTLLVSVLVMVTVKPLPASVPLAIQELTVNGVIPFWLLYTDWYYKTWIPESRNLLQFPNNFCASGVNLSMSLCHMQRYTRTKIDQYYGTWEVEWKWRCEFNWIVFDVVTKVDQPCSTNNWIQMVSCTFIDQSLYLDIFWCRCMNSLQTHWCDTTFKLSLAYCWWWWFKSFTSCLEWTTSSSRSRCLQEADCVTWGNGEP